MPKQFGNILGSLDHCRQWFHGEKLPRNISMLKKIQDTEKLIVMTHIINSTISNFHGKWLDVIAHCFWFGRRHSQMKIPMHQLNIQIWVGLNAHLNIQIWLKIKGWARSSRIQICVNLNAHFKLSNVSIVLEFHINGYRFVLIVFFVD